MGNERSVYFILEGLERNCTRTKKSCLRHSFLVQFLVSSTIFTLIPHLFSQPTSPPTPLLHPANLCSQVPTHGVHVCVYVCGNLITVHYRIERIPCKIAVAGHAGQPGHRNRGTHFPTCPAWFAGHFAGFLAGQPGHRNRAVSSEASGDESLEYTSLTVAGLVCVSCVRV